MGREVFTRPFAAALHQACTGRGLTQKQVGELIAARQHEHRRRGPEREQAIATAQRQWPGRLSAWKKGDRLPASVDELFLALDVIAPDTPRKQWEQWWRQARDQSTTAAVSLPMPSPLASMEETGRTQNDQRLAELVETLTVLGAIRWSPGEPSADVMGRAVTLLRDQVGALTPDELGFRLLRCGRTSLSTNTSLKTLVRRSRHASHPGTRRATGQASASTGSENRRAVGADA